MEDTVKASNVFFKRCVALAAREDSSGARAAVKACELQNYDPDEDSREERPTALCLDGIRNK